ncbi:MAG: type ISP restriction/modification enzyme, partial [Anaerolineae bacterium]|nr:type ISP restriction/modification enzyme [Anaerolineae bacterium]
MTPLETYLQKLADNRNVVTPESGHYAALADLLTETGRMLSPAMRAVVHTRNIGAGIPDLALYSERQDTSLTDQLPEGGVVEAKPLTHDLLSLAQSDQVRRYAERYGVVLVTNYYQFMVVSLDERGKLCLEERYDLAPDVESFWQNVRRLAKQHEKPFTEFLLRVLRRNAPLNTPRDLAWLLASYARAAKLHLDSLEMSDELKALRAEFEKALEIDYEGAKGDAFFRAALIQTLFYGVFAAWVVWHQSELPESQPFDLWRDTRNLNIPVISDLFHQISIPTRLKALGLEHLLEWTAAALRRVNRPAFFQSFNEGTAVQYFYEPFLQAFAPDLRKSLGVWYTPPEIVQYMVARVDQVLRSELGIEDGLADEQVYVLDPCCGTGAYLVEVLRHIHKWASQRYGAPMAAQIAADAATTRLFGFEVLSAPFVIAHMQVSLLLHQWGVRLSRRPTIYLTNALTGWGKPAAEPQMSLIKSLVDERLAASAVKTSRRILVVLGNPPYNAYAGVSEPAEGRAVDVYKQGLREEWGIKKYNLDDMYVRFFRLAERAIAELNAEKRGVVCYISNYSWLREPSFVVMRQRLLQTFDKFWIDDLKGAVTDKTPDSRSSQSIFTIDKVAIGIKVGTAISLWVRTGKGDYEAPNAQVFFRGDLNAAKAADRRQQLLASLADPDLKQRYQRIQPSPAVWYRFRPLKISAEYARWHSLTDLCAVPPFNGPVERRGLALIDRSKETIEKRLRAYFDLKVSDEEVRLLHPKLVMTGNRIRGELDRRRIAEQFKFDGSKIVRYPFKPFDVRWCYLDNIRPLFSEPSPQLLALRRVPSNAFFITRDTSDKANEGVPFYFSPLVCDYDFLSGHARHFPLYYIQKPPRTPRNKSQKKLAIKIHDKPIIRANLSESARAYLAAFGIDDVDANPESAALIWLHALAIGYSLAYLSENKDGIQLGFPRIPLPADRELFLESAKLGRQVADLLDTEREVPSVTTGNLRPEITSIARLETRGSASPDFKVTAGWGRLSKGAVQPSKGKLIKAASSDAYDVYLNETTYWANVPRAVWEYTIGGYQVLKKWLSYRDEKILEQELKFREVQEFTNIARRIAALLALSAALDA